MPDARWGLQLYTLRDEVARDFPAVLRQVADWGFAGVELAGYGHLTLAQLRDCLAETGLQVIGSHLSLERLEGNLAQEIAEQHALGARYVACPWLSPAQRQSQCWPDYPARFARIGVALREAGLQLCYHNHDFELQIRVDGELALDYLLAHSDPALLQLELDAGWVAFAGHDPARWLQRYSGRVPLLHVKDYRRLPEGQIETLPLGRGELAIGELLAAARPAGVKWLIVEQDECSSKPLDDVAQSVAYLRSLGEL